MNAKELMTLSIEVGASDLHLNPGRPPVGRVDGKLVSLSTEVVDDATAERWCRELCDDKHWDELLEVGTTDIGLAHESGTRFRVSCMKQRGRFGAVLRLIPSDLLTFDQIGLPDTVQQLLRRPLEKLPPHPQVMRLQLPWLAHFTPPPHRMWLPLSP